MPLTSLVILADGRAIAGVSGADPDARGRGGASCSVYSWTPDGALSWVSEVSVAGVHAVRLQTGDGFVLANTLANATSFDVDTGAVTRQTQLFPNSPGAVIVPNGARMFVREVSFATHAFDLKEGSIYVAKLEPGTDAAAMAISPDASRLVLAGTTCRVFDAASLAHLASFTLPAAPTHAVFTPGGEIVTADGEGRICRHTLRGERTLEVQLPGAGIITSVATARSGAIAVARGTDVVALASNGAISATHAGHVVRPGGVLAIAFTPDAAALWVNARTADELGLTRYGCP